MQALIGEYNQIIRDTDRELETLFLTYPNVATSDKFAAKHRVIKEF